MKRILGILSMLFIAPLATGMEQDLECCYVKVNTELTQAIELLKGSSNLDSRKALLNWYKKTNKHQKETKNKIDSHLNELTKKICSKEYPESLNLETQEVVGMPEWHKQFLCKKGYQEDRITVHTSLSLRMPRTLFKLVSEGPMFAQAATPEEFEKIKQKPQEEAFTWQDEQAARDYLNSIK